MIVDLVPQPLLQISPNYFPKSSRQEMPARREKRPSRSTPHRALGRSINASGALEVRQKTIVFRAKKPSSSGQWVPDRAARADYVAEHPNELVGFLCLDPTPAWLAVTRW